MISVYQVADLDSFGDVGLGGRIIFVGASRVGDDGGVELFGKFAAERRHAAVGVAGDLLREGFVVDRFDGLAKLVGEVFDEGVELGFEFFCAGLLLDAAFDFKTSLFAGELPFALLQGFAFDGGGGELVVELVEEGPDVRGLGGHLGACGGDDLGLQAEPGRDVEARGRSWNAKTQLVGRSQSLLVEADSGVEDSGMIGGVDLERGEVRGDAAPRVEGEEVSRDGDCEGRAFLGSVAEPSSSSRMRESAVASREMRSRLTT